jgi:hypothetical protein
MLALVRQAHIPSKWTEPCYWAVSSLNVARLLTGRGSILHIATLNEWRTVRIRCRERSWIWVTCGTPVRPSVRESSSRWHVIKETHGNTCKWALLVASHVLQQTVVAGLWEMRCQPAERNASPRSLHLSLPPVLFDVDSIFFNQNTNRIAHKRNRVYPILKIVLQLVIGLWDLFKLHCFVVCWCWCGSEGE